MEVHSHPHTERKRLAHYFFEFFMLFLAIFCGFIAENWREHMVEKERGRQYIQSFYADLKKDTSVMSAIIEIESEKIRFLSHLEQDYDSIQRGPNGTKLLFDIIRHSLGNNQLHIADRTLRQLSNAGGFRLLKKADADSIAGYEEFAKDIEDNQSTIYQQSQDNLRKTLNELVEFKAYSGMYRDVINHPFPDQADGGLPVLFSTDKTILNKYFLELFQYLRVTVSHLGYMKLLRFKAEGIIEYFKSKYHLQ
jgi:hypothetical protein